MLKIEDWLVSGMSAAIRGMRLPYKTTEAGDSYYAFWDFEDMTARDRMLIEHSDHRAVEARSKSVPGIDFDGEVLAITGNRTLMGYEVLKIGDKDLQLAKKLAVAGSDHGKFMRMIHVQVLVKAPLYWWKEMDTYKVATVTNSESTMHTIAKKPFHVDDFSFEHLDDGIDLKTCGEYTTKELTPPYTHLWNTISLLNANRQAYLETKDKHYWWQMIQLLPTSYNQTRMLDLNYQTLQNVYRARRNHKLDEWHTFCNWIEEALPYSELITGFEYDGTQNYEGE